MGIRGPAPRSVITDLTGWPPHVVKKHYMHVTDEIRHDVAEFVDPLPPAVGASAGSKLHVLPETGGPLWSEALQLATSTTATA